jgi:hypothetical protein
MLHRLLKQWVYIMWIMGFLNGKESFVQHVYFLQMKTYLIFQLEEIIQKRVLELLE